MRRTPWPAPRERDGDEPARVGIVVANSNTRRLVAHLIFSLYRLLGESEFAQLAVVDNASTDGSRELLEALHEARLLQLIGNRTEQYHGPALTKGISWLASRQSTVDHSEQIDYIWVLDSDVVVLRRDTLRSAVSLFGRRSTAAVGQKFGDPAYDRILRHNREMLHPCSLLLDPWLVWRPPIPPFVEDGAPATELQVAADLRRLVLAPFPFVEGRYLLHLGRGTLREVAEAGETSNRYYDWAVDHRDYHFAGETSGPTLYRTFCTFFDAQVGELSPANLVTACRPRRLSQVE